MNFITKTWQELIEEFEVIDGTDERKVSRRSIMEEFVWFATEKYGCPRSLQFQPLKSENDNPGPKQI